MQTDLFDFVESIATPTPPAPMTAPPASLPPGDAAESAAFVASAIAIPLADAKHAFRHRMALAGYSSLATTATGAWDEAAARRACNALLGRPASDRPEPSLDDWTTAARSLRVRSDAGFVTVPALEGWAASMAKAAAP